MTGTPSPKLPRISPDEMSARVRELWEGSMALRGDATFFEVMAHAPQLLDWYVNDFYGSVFYSGRIPPPVFELLRLRLSARHGCKFCNQGNREAARAAGLSDAEIDALFSDDFSVLSPAQKAVAALADALNIANADGALDDELHAALSEHFTPGEIVEMGLVGGMLAGVAKFLFVFDLVEREETCPFPQSSRD